MERPALLMAALIVLSAIGDVIGHAPSAALVLPAVWLGGLALACGVARLVRRSPRAGAVLVRLLIDGAALAAVPSLIEAARISLMAAAYGGPLVAAGRVFLTSRLAPQFADLNAAGSFFALFGLTAWWLCRAP